MIHFGLLEPTGRSSHVLRAATLPSKAFRGWVDLGQYRDPITYQWEGNCASNAVPLSCSQTLRAKGIEVPWTPSIRETYAVTLARLRAQDHPTLDVRTLMTRYPLVDTGSELLDVVDTVQLVGLCAMGALFGGEFTDDGPVPSEPSHGAVREQLRNLMVGCREVVSLNDVQAALESGVTCPTGGWVDDSFIGWTREQPPVGAQDRNRSGGGHAVRAEAVGRVGPDGCVTEWAVVDGIDWSRVQIVAPPGTRVWRVVNSWGRDSYGLGGCAIVGDAFLADRWEKYACDVEVV